MSDFLLELSKNAQARNLVKSLGLPIPMPQDLRRARGPSVERPLDDRDVAIWGDASSVVLKAAAPMLAEAGANPHTDEALLGLFREAGEAYGRPAAQLDLSDERKLFGGLLFDATQIDTVEGLDSLYTFFHPLMGKIARCGRIVVIARPHGLAKTAAAASAQRALEGFVRSAAKEIGKRGATAQLLIVEPGAEDRMAGPLRFLLSERSAYVTGQPVKVSATAKALDRVAWVAPLEGKVALVTGAARGIGAATARLLAFEGAKVVCLDRPADDGPTSKLAREINGAVLLADVTDDGAPAQIAQALKDDHGGVDIVVHNAGVTRDKTLGRMNEERWRQVLGVNLVAVNRVTAALVDGVLKDDGRLICLSSIAGIAGNVGQTNYAASKAGIIGFVEMMSTQLASRGVTVNAIAPGFIETRLTAAIPVAIREVARRMNALSQGGQPDDVAQAINFLASPGAQGLTGNVLRVCGGSLVGA